MVTENKKRLFPTPPESPVDGYELKWYQISVSSNWWYLSEKKAVYHVNTPWNKFSPNERGGADLVDDWMIYKNGYAEGRWTGWNAPCNLTYWENCFHTKAEALAEIRKRLETYVTEELKKVRYIKKMIAEVKGVTP